MDTISVRLLERLSYKQQLDSCLAISANGASIEFQSNLIIDNLNAQVNQYKANERDLKAAADLSGHTIADQRLLLKAEKKKEWTIWLTSGGIAFGLGGVVGYELRR